MKRRYDPGASARRSLLRWGQQQSEPVWSEDEVELITEVFSDLEWAAVRAAERDQERGGRSQ